MVAKCSFHKFWILKTWVPAKCRAFPRMIFQGESNGQSSFARRRRFRLSVGTHFATFQWWILKCWFWRGILISWVVPMERFEFRALKWCHFMVANWIFMKFQNFNIFFKCGRSWPLTCLKMLVGLRWREFQCLAARGVAFLPLPSFFNLHGAKHSPYRGGV